ncbi:MAG: hypothetical protein JXJ22_07650, partial [Bacteroidales bacterium]|nr:hypothetical protein [Bacteroidales bacterium]
KLDFSKSIELLEKLKTEFPKDDETMIRLDNIMKHHGYVTAEILRIDPFWDPVRNHQKFMEIISNPLYQVNPSPVVK